MTFPTLPTELHEFKQRAVEMANRHHAAMQGMTKKQAMQFVKEILAENELVVAVWQDPDEPDGVGMLLIKGKPGSNMTTTNTHLEVLTAANPRWNQFAEALHRAVFPPGERWRCNQHHWQGSQQAELIMTAMGNIDIPASLAYFKSLGGYCDCEILLNVVATRGGLDA
jgi:hypothetical protein